MTVYSPQGHLPENTSAYLVLHQESLLKLFSFLTPRVTFGDIGNYTEIKDKIITLKDKWESDYYKTVAEDYLQTTLEVLQKANRRITLKEIAACLDFDTLVDRVRLTNHERLADKISALKHYQRDSLSGFLAHLNLLINSELGKYLAYDKESFTLMEAIERRAVVYFALPALKYSSFVSMLGK